MLRLDSFVGDFPIAPIQLYLFICYFFFGGTVSGRADTHVIRGEEEKKEEGHQLELTKNLNAETVVFCGKTIESCEKFI